MLKLYTLIINWKCEAAKTMICYIEVPIKAGLSE